ncbi:probable ABC transporter permease protein YurM [Arthrobacter sp. Hiyo4]|nr:probable ABC transporter permease protein YurM [Arthrobacter sp. Hiyo4]
MAVMWLIPLGWSLFTALRPVDSTNQYGYFSFAGDFNFDNFTQAWTQGGFSTYFWNSVIITVPAVLLTLFLASLMAFAVSRVNWKFNITLLIMFTAGNLLPRRSSPLRCSRWQSTSKCRTPSAIPETC